MLVGCKVTGETVMRLKQFGLLDGFYEDFLSSSFFFLLSLIAIPLHSSPTPSFKNEAVI